MPESKVLWARGQWKCSRRVDADGTLWIDCSDDDDLVLTCPVTDAEQLHAVADGWRHSLIEDDSSHLGHDGISLRLSAVTRQLRPTNSRNYH